jgi:anti-sigma factor RsiW
MTDAPSEDLLLQAAVDGELDAAGMIAFEARLAADPALATNYARLAALRAAVGARAPRPKAPDALRARVLALAAPPALKLVTPAARAPWRFAPRYGALAASLAVGLLLGAGGARLLGPGAGEDAAERAAVAGYVRGRLADQPFDVASTDRHTVKPWFAGKIAGATTVVDLKTDGFALIGGRIDVIGETPVATLIYQRREHQIALSELPASLEPGAGLTGAASRDGFSLIGWSDRQRRYIAVSDLPAAELDAFAAAFQRAAEAEREEPAKP